MHVGRNKLVALR